jgi:hypothetical protein
MNKVDLTNTDSIGINVNRYQTSSFSFIDKDIGVMFQDSLDGLLFYQRDSQTIK